MADEKQKCECLECRIRRTIRQFYIDQGVPPEQGIECLTAARVLGTCMTEILAMIPPELAQQYLDEMRPAIERWKLVPRVAMQNPVTASKH